jgi:hypothetical protein
VEAVIASAQHIKDRYGDKLFYAPGSEAGALVQQELDRFSTMSKTELSAVMTAISIIIAADQTGTLLEKIAATAITVNAVESQIGDVVSGPASIVEPEVRRRQAHQRSNYGYGE